jgi:hypothetical protein
MKITGRAFEVDRSILSAGRFVDETLAAGEDGAVLAVRHFALTANNVT